MKKLLFILILFIFCCYLFAAPSKSYRVLSRHSVKDNATGLIWTRCSLGNDNKPIYDFNCKGEKKKFLLKDAIDACETLNLDGRSDWRLPSIKELQSIMVYYDYSTEFLNTAAANEDVFPNIITRDEYLSFIRCFEIAQENPSHNCTSHAIHYWSSTMNSDNLFWFGDFFFGLIGWYFIEAVPDWNILDEYVVKYVRCVAGP